MKKIAITGGLSSGKSTVCRFLKDLGAFVVSADEIVHQILSPQTPLGHKILSLLGPEVISDGKFDRGKIASIVFNDQNKLKALEKILHPAVLEAIEKTYQSVKKEKRYPLFIAEIPLLFESESHTYFDTVIAVVSDPKLCRQRFTEKTSHTFEEFERRMARQLPPDLKAAKASYTITNNGSLEELRTNVQTLYETLR